MKRFLLNVISSPYLYIVLTIIVFSISSSSLSYINVGRILKSYFKEIVFEHRLINLFIVIPILLAQTLNLVSMVDASIIDNISVSISILISMFFAYMAFYDEYKSVKKSEASKTQITKSVIKESQIIVSYEIFLCVILLVLSMFYQLFNDNNWIIYQINYRCQISSFSIYSLIIYALFIHLILNLLVLLKRYNFLKDKNSDTHQS